jgi:hypothetical protein
MQPTSAQREVASSLLADFRDNLLKISIGLRHQYDVANGQNTVLAVLPLEESTELTARRGRRKSMAITLGLTERESTTSAVITLCLSESCLTGC